MATILGFLISFLLILVSVIILFSSILLLLNLCFDLITIIKIKIKKGIIIAANIFLFSLFVPFSFFNFIFNLFFLC